MKISEDFDLNVQWICSNATVASLCYEYELIQIDDTSTNTSTNIDATDTYWEVYSNDTLYIYYDRTTAFRRAALEYYKCKRCVIEIYEYEAKCTLLAALDDSNGNYSGSDNGNSIPVPINTILHKN